MKRFFAAFAALLVVGAAFGHWLFALRGGGPEGKLTPTPGEAEIAARLSRTVTMLATTIGVRHLEAAPEKLIEAREFLAQALKELGFEVQREKVATPSGAVVENLWIEVPGKGQADELVLFAANYDSMKASPGADTNASGAAALLELARSVRERFARPVRLAFFVNKEPPFFGTEAMGSRVHARTLAVGGRKVAAMVNLQSLGIFDDRAGTQTYPAGLGLLLTDRARFLALIGNLPSRGLVRTAGAAFEAAGRMPFLAIALPELVPGVDWSDHRSFWTEGVPALMVSDTALYRTKAFGGPDDVPAKLDFTAMARGVVAVQALLRQLAN